jgi:hypothetical protein
VSAMDPRCPACAETVDPAAARCPHCGEPLQAKPKRVAPVLPPERWGSPQKPVAVLIIAIILGGFAALGLLMGIAALATSRGSNPMGLFQPPELTRVLNEPAYVTFMAWAYRLGIVVNALSLAAAIGLLRMRSWARTLTIGLQVYTLVALVAGAAVSWVLLVQPLMADPQVSPPMLGGAIGGAAGSVCCGWIFPAVFIFFLCRPEVKAGFAYWSAPPPPPVQAT